MNYLVGGLVLDADDKPRVRIRFSDGREVTATYIGTFGYNHTFRTDAGGELRLSNHFMHLKDIRVTREA